MHSLSSVSIRNFRSCFSVDIILSDFTPLVGYNNGGKSNILRAVKWLLRPAVLQEIDFCDSSTSVVVQGTISGITEGILENLIPQHRTRIEPYCLNGNLIIRRTQSTPGGAVRNIILEIRDPAIDDENSDRSWNVNPNGIEQAIKAIFPEPIEIGAMEDAIEDVCKYKSGTTIGKLISEIMSPIEQKHGAAINKALEGIKRKLEAEGAERAQEFIEFDQFANAKLMDLFPGIQIRLHVPAPEIKEIFKSGTIKIIEEGETSCREVIALGHGAQRSIQMALIRYLADIKSQDNQNPTRTLLLIDEPELYLHPQAIEHVRLALKALSLESYQIIFATHSPMMIGTSDIGSTVIVRKNTNNHSFSKKRLSDAIMEVVGDAPSQIQTLFELGNSGQILFSNKVVVAEGKTEQRLLPEIYSRVNNCTLSANKTALISPGGSGNTVKCLKILAVMEIPAKAVVDLDFAFKDALRNHLINANDPEIITCKTIFAQLAQNHDFKLAEDGFPRKGGAITPSAAFVILANHPEAIEPIENLHQKLKANGIWLWKKGAIEEYLGIDGKNEKSWARYTVRLNEKGCQATIADYNGVIEMLDWINQ